jgi:hypothetical protein
MTNIATRHGPERARVAVLSVMALLTYGSCASACE